MRETKFRAKIQGHVGYVFGVPHNIYADKNQKDKWFDSMQYIDENGDPQEEYIEIETLSEYTGLKDKNGVEIYEGDILQTIDGVVVVSMETGCFWVDDDISISSPLYVYADEAENWSEVIGNIHANPELIK